MIAFTTATAQALATTAGGDKALKLTPAKRLILQACTGYGDSPIFIPPPVFASLATEGATSDAIGLTLRRMLQPDSLKFSQKTQLYVSPQLVQTVKTFNFSASGDKSYLNCTRDITIFAVPWRSYESMTEEAAEEEYYQQSTVKTTADVRKHQAAAKFYVPSELLGHYRLFNNYCKLLSVLFGPDCPHLISVLAIRDGLELHEYSLELKLAKLLCLHLLWRVHFDARQFFTTCKWWASGASLPHSALGNTISQLVDDCFIAESQICPVTHFMGSTLTVKGAAGAAGAKSGHGTKPTTNPSIPSLCQPLVEKFNSLHTSMSFASLIKKGGLQPQDLLVGRKGDSSSFGLMGRCTSGCKYYHVVCTVSLERQGAKNALLKSALALLSRSRPTTGAGGAPRPAAP
jgi:hypothetical protein